MLILSLSACGFRQDISDFEQDVNMKMGQIPSGHGLSPYSENANHYIDGYTLSLEGGEIFLKGKKVTIHEKGAYLADIGDKIASATNVVVRYSPELSKRRDIVNTTMTIKYSGELSGLLDKVSAYYNINWEYSKKEDSILFYYMKTKVYSIAAYMGDLEIETEISNKSDSTGNASSTGGSETGGSSGINEHTVKTEAKYKAWDEFTENIRKMITKDGSVVASKGAGTITVTESPTVLSRIDEYMQSMQNKMSRQVSINVTVYNFKSKDELNLSASLNGVFNDGKTGILFGDTPNNQISTVGSFSSSILTGSNSKWAGSTALANAMKSKGLMTLETTAAGIVQNNQPLPIQALRRTTYLASSSTTLNGDSSETELVPGQIVSGMSIMVTPHIQPDDTVNLEYNMSYSVVESIEKIEAGNSSIQTPEVSSRSFMQRFQVKTGSTVIIAGYASDIKSENSGIGILGGLFGRSDEKEYVVIMMDITDATLPAYISDASLSTNSLIINASQGETLGFSRKNMVA